MRRVRFLIVPEALRVSAQLARWPDGSTRLGLEPTVTTTTTSSPFASTRILYHTARRPYALPCGGPDRISFHRPVATRDSTLLLNAALAHAPKRTPMLYDRAPAS
jgi:hypothetical protein